jgi:hypothetical protein
MPTSARSAIRYLASLIGRDFSWDSGLVSSGSHTSGGQLPTSYDIHWNESYPYPLGLQMNPGRLVLPCWPQSSVLVQREAGITRKHLLVLGAICIACSDGSSSGTGTPAAPASVLGDFQDDYGIEYAITPSRWQQKPNALYHIVYWDSVGQFAIARNDASNPSDGGKWTRIDWLELDDMAPYTWAFCLTAYDAESRAEAEATEPAQRATPRTGCGGFPFSRMQQIEIR